MTLPPFSLSAYLFPWHYRSLLGQFVRRAILGRYSGSILGVGWSFVMPLLMLAIYTLVFRGVFQARWGNADVGGGDFALNLFAGLLIFNLFGEVVGAAPRLIIDQPNLVKKVVFPLEILPWVSLGAALFHMAAGLGILIVASLFLRGGLAVTTLLLPFVLLPLLPFLLGLAWLFAAVGTFVRDIAQAIGTALNLMLFLSPVFYPASALPVPWRNLMWLNPLTLPVESLRTILLEGHAPEWTALAIYSLISLTVAAIGARIFHTARSGFGDVL